jgi:hypothetical protein
MPSIETEVASTVRHVNCTWSPAEITVGVAVRCAVGAGAAADGGAACGGGIGFCFLQPDTATRAKSRKIGTRTNFLLFNLMLLPEIWTFVLVIRSGKVPLQSTLFRKSQSLKIIAHNSDCARKIRVKQ